METYNALFPQTPWIHNVSDVQQSQDAAQAAVQGDPMSTHPSTVDINHPSFGLAEIQQASSSSSSTIAPAALYQTFAPLAQSGHAGFYAPFNVMAYGQTPWTQQHLPLSSYSTLNGATTGPSQPQQRQDSPSIQPMLIDPSLTINGTASSSGSHSFSQNGVDHQAQQSAYQSLFAHSSSLQHQQTLSINPMYVNALSHQQLQQQQHQQHQQQTTLSPTALHSPTASSSSFYPTSSAAPMQTNMTASSSNSASSSSSTENLTQKKNRTQAKMKGLPNLTGAGAVKGIVNEIEDCGILEVDPASRLDIITRIRDKSPAHFLRAWCENAGAMDITREWLKEGAAKRDNGPYEETVMPLLQVIARLPFTVEQLKSYKLGKIIVKLTKEPPNAAIKDMAADIEKGWKQLIADHQDGTSKKIDGNIEDKTKKRKLGESSKAAPPAKKVATSSSSRSSATVKKETKVVTSVVKESKSDSSFFSQSKAKAKLPSFKKAPNAPAGTPGVGGSAKSGAAAANVAQCSDVDPFQLALESMKNRKGSPMQTTIDSTPISTTTVKSEASKPGRKRKSVTWAPDGKLEQIKLIEKAIYDDDPMDGSHSSHSIRELERAEGAAMHAHLFEEAIDWHEPIAIQFPEDIQQQPLRGSSSQERDAQEEREKSSLEVLYVNVSQVPETPAEPTTQIPIEQVDAEAKTMMAGSEIQPFFASAMSVSQLVGQLKGADVGAGQGGAEQQQGFPNAMDMGSFSTPDVQMVMQSLMGSASANNAGLPPSDGNNATAQFDLRQLGLDPSALSSLTSLLGGGSAGAASTNGTNPNPFGSMYPDAGNAGTSNGYAAGIGNDYGSGPNGYGDRPRGDRDRDEHSGRGRRGRGRGGAMDGFRHKRKAAPCMFFQQGRCKFGDACDFSHDPAQRDGGAGGGSSGYFD
ncbi:hypothetical protein SCHPADRAFT_870627 [Schizopora paradoxa]|uniref:Serine/threonine-protein phosphatase 1 regulatory subunit 10 n=1 Tax=Schizopora paradoxa TaxID=27342 RepID=A0A0H2SF64_9AGAM|nr:hypothetical protein SCHPADRAFT_870627 [Schizopora paradoxa]